MFEGPHCFGTVVAKMDVHRDKALRGYIAMLTVEKEYRYLGVGEAPAACLGSLPAGCAVPSAWFLLCAKWGEATA